MAVGTLALLFGVVFLAVGLIGFGAAPPPPDAPPLVVEQGHGLHGIIAVVAGIIGFAMPVRAVAAR